MGLGKVAEAVALAASTQFLGICVLASALKADWGALWVSCALWASGALSVSLFRRVTARREGAVKMLVYLDDRRRVVVYPEGGWRQERHVLGIGWVDADGEEWGDAKEVPASFAGALMRMRHDSA